MGNASRDLGFETFYKLQDDVTIQIHLDYCKESKGFKFLIDDRAEVLRIESDNFGAINFLYQCKHWISNWRGYDIVLIGPVQAWRITPQECKRRGRPIPVAA